MHIRATERRNAKEEQLLPDGRVNVFNARQRLPGEFPFVLLLPPSTNRVINKVTAMGNGWVDQWVVLEPVGGDWRRGSSAQK